MSEIPGPVQGPPTPLPEGLQSPTVEQQGMPDVKSTYRELIGNLSAKNEQLGGFLGVTVGQPSNNPDNAFFAFSTITESQPRAGHPAELLIVTIDGLKNVNLGIGGIRGELPNDY